MIQPKDTFSTNLEVCYEVLLYLASQMQSLNKGDVLEFISSDPQAGDRISEWVVIRNYELITMETLADGQTRFLIRR